MFVTRTPGRLSSWLLLLLLLFLLLLLLLRVCLCLSACVVVPVFRVCVSLFSCCWMGSIVHTTAPEGEQRGLSPIGCRPQSGVLVVLVSCAIVYRGFPPSRHQSHYILRFDDLMMGLPTSKVHRTYRTCIKDKRTLRAPTPPVFDALSGVAQKKQHAHWRRLWVDFFF
eukprot:m.96897 g.96897  ORF g.96897 m.96897 type:complete len:168 (-) comp15206_c2_seq2:29-532(-)